MDLTLNGEQRLNATPERVWEALTDPTVLQRCIPGCKQLELVEEGVYQAVLEIGVAAVKGRFAGQVRMTEMAPPQHLILDINGEGANGFVHAHGQLDLEPGEASTRLVYQGHAEVGGKIAGVGQRIMSGVAKFLVGQFFKTLDHELAEPHEREKESEERQ
ncbi:MAG: carbon monoxide dehydrogenase subunit G [Candidatus Bipolaricaulia bacterium]